MAISGAELTHQAIMDEGDFGVPAQDSVDNVDWGDVVGNKTDTVGGTSLVSLIKSAGGGTNSHAPLTIGSHWYVDVTQADDSQDGATPETAKKTIAAGLALMSAGDILNVASGTYDEAGLDMNLAGMQMWCETGVIIADTTPGTCLVVSGLACYVRSAHFVQAGGVGVQVTGIGAILDRCVAVNCTIGFDIDQHSTQAYNCVSATHTITGFDIGQHSTRLIGCFARGAGAATRGFYLSAAAVAGCELNQCHSVGNATAGFETVAGTGLNDIVNCSSGGGDGRRVNAAGTSNVFANFSPNEHAILFGGTVWYVDGATGANTNDGLTPTTARETIGSAIGSMAAGDAVSIRTGTYDEDGLDLNLTGLEMWGEIGANVINTVGTECLTVSGNFCRVRQMSFHQAGVIGIVVSGYECELDDVRVEDATVSYDINGAETTVCTCTSLEHTVTGFDISTDANILRKCTAINGGATRGFYLSHADADNNLLDDCSSIGNGVAGYEAIPTALQNTFKDCSSGGGDGSRIGVVGNVWSNYTFDDHVYHETDFSIVGGGAGSDNLFQIAGTVQCSFIYGDVETVLANDVGNLKLELDDGAAQTDIATNVGVSNAPVGSFIVNEETGKALDYYTSASAQLITKVEIKKSSFSIVQKAATATYIRCTWDGNAASGIIHWHLQWEPLTEDGFVTAV